MAQSSNRIQILTWADFDEFWQELEESHEQTPYTFDAYDEEVARIAFKAGREKEVIAKGRLRSMPITMAVDGGVYFIPTQRRLFAVRAGE